MFAILLIVRYVKHVKQQKTYQGCIEVCIVVLFILFCTLKAGFVAGQENNNAPALLLLPGFGVGSFHYDQQLRELGQEYRVWAMDFLGQGNSWPSHDPAPASEQQIEEVVEGQVKAELGDWGFGKTVEPWAQELVYSVDTWRDQVQAFVEEVSVYHQLFSNHCRVNYVCGGKMMNPTCCSHLISRLYS